ncbi:hypothetical protein EYF80_025209 [Liparis tanakae]|uniref:Uncharacterized protein n=1 Tax=Liparis tanakae TaxID=230148 RepID=A0A4Z2HIA7_9TELE|nr:hypothetical protein EYF80_025209 [Liparis tanakae]
MSVMTKIRKQHVITTCQSVYVSREHVSRAVEPGVCAHMWTNVTKKVTSSRSRNRAAAGELRCARIVQPRETSPDERRGRALWGQTELAQPNVFFWALIG